MQLLCRNVALFFHPRRSRFLHIIYLLNHVFVHVQGFPPLCLCVPKTGSSSSCYAGLHSNTTRRITEFDFQPMPSHLPTYLSHKQVFSLVSISASIARQRLFLSLSPLSPSPPLSPRCWPTWRTSVPHIVRLLASTRA